MIGLYLRAYRHVAEARPLIVRYAGGYSLGVALWIVSLPLDAPERYVLWGIGLAWEYALPWLARYLFATIPVHTSHVPERFALFTIVVLGESVLAVALGVAGRDWALSAAIIAGLGFFLAASVWWMYFGHGLELSLERSALSVLVFAYAHIPLLAALTAVGAGITLAIEQSSEPGLDAGTRWALAGGDGGLPRLPYDRAAPLDPRLPPANRRSRGSRGQPCWWRSRSSAARSSRSPSPLSPPGSSSPSSSSRCGARIAWPSRGTSRRARTRSRREEACGRAPRRARPGGDARARRRHWCSRGSCPATTSPGHQVDEGAELVVERPPPYRLAGRGEAAERARRVRHRRQRQGLP